MLVKFEKDIKSCSECPFYIETDAEYHPAYCRLIEYLGVVNDLDLPIGFEYIDNFNQYWKWEPVLSSDSETEINPKCPFTNDFWYYIVLETKKEYVGEYITKYKLCNDLSAEDFYKKKK